MLRVVYDLREAEAHIAAVQDATLHTDYAGLVSEHGLFGSGNWWRAVEDGRIPVRTVKGTISRVYASGHNDYPEFEVDDGADRTQWTREGPDDAYVVGRAIQIDYVLQRYKKPLRIGPHSKSVLRILIDHEGSV
jgi:hypothetical protein